MCACVWEWGVLSGWALDQNLLHQWFIGSQNSRRMNLMEHNEYYDIVCCVDVDAGWNASCLSAN